MLTVLRDVFLRRGRWSYLGLLIACHTLSAGEPPAAMRVAITPNAPFVMYDSSMAVESRQPEGFNIDLWQGLAADLGTTTRWQYHAQAAQVFRAVHFKEADVGLVAFPPGSLALGLQAMVLEGQSIFYMVKRAVKKFLSEVSAKVFWIPILVFIGAGNIRWLIDRLEPAERRKFPNHYFIGIFEASWWNLCLLLEWEATGDKNNLARLYDLFWHLGGIILLSSFIGLLTATLTIQSVNEKVSEASDLEGRVVAVLPGAAQVAMALKVEEIREISDLEQATQLLVDAEVAAVLGPSVLLQTHVQAVNAEDKIQLRVLPGLIHEQRWAVVMAPDHPRRADVDRLLAQFNLPRGLQPSLASELAAKWKIGE